MTEPRRSSSPPGSLPGHQRRRERVAREHEARVGTPPSARPKPDVARPLGPVPASRRRPGLEAGHGSAMPWGSARCTSPDRRAGLAWSPPNARSCPAVPPDPKADGRGPAWPRPGASLREPDGACRASPPVAVHRITSPERASARVGAVRGSFRDRSRATDPRGPTSRGSAGRPKPRHPRGFPLTGAMPAGSPSRRPPKRYAAGSYRDDTRGVRRPPKRRRSRAAARRPTGAAASEEVTRPGAAVSGAEAEASNDRGLDPEGSPGAEASSGYPGLGVPEGTPAAQEQ